MSSSLVLVLSLVAAGMTPVWSRASDSLTLSDFLKSAFEKNPLTTELDFSIMAAQEEKASKRGAFWPELGVGAGIEKYRSSQETVDGTGFYGYGKWNLFRGFQDFALEKQANVRVVLSEMEATQARMELATQVREAFTQALWARDSLKVLSQSIDDNKIQAQIAEKKKRAGITSVSDVLEFELRGTELESDLLLTKEEFSRAIFKLGELSGWQHLTDQKIVGELTAEKINPDLGFWLASGSSKNVDVAKSGLERDQADWRVLEALGKRSPTLDFEGKYGKLLKPDQEIRGSPAWSLALSVQLPLFSGLTTKHEIDAAKARAAAADARTEREMRDTKIKISESFSKAQMLWARIELEEKNIDRLERYFKLTLDEYRRGVKNSPDMAGAAARLTHARLGLLGFKRDYQVAILKLRELTTSL